MRDTPIPDEALASHIAILGKTGSGKSNAAKVVAEGLMRAGHRTCVIDPTGTWYGLRELRELDLIEHSGGLYRLHEELRSA